MPSFVCDLERFRELASNRQGLVRQACAATPPTGHVGERLGERLALDELENEEPDPFRHFNAVNRADIGMIQRGEHAGFALEARESIGIADESRRQDLDGDITSKLRVVSPVYLSHAAHADQGL